MEQKNSNPKINSPSEVGRRDPNLVILFILAGVLFGIWNKYLIVNTFLPKPIWGYMFIGGLLGLMLKTKKVPQEQIKRIYFWSGLVGFFAGPLTIITAIFLISSDFVNLSWLGDGVFGAILATLIYFTLVIMPSVILFSVVVFLLWKFVGRLHERYPLISVFKIILFFTIGTVIAVIILNSLLFSVGPA